MHSLKQKFKLTRIAPTPSGYLHLGNALSFALTAAIANSTGARILLRIDDLDRERVTDSYVNDVFETLEFLNIQWQAGPPNAQRFQKEWSQLCRLHLYQPALDQLANNKMVYACTCSRKQLHIPGYTCNCAEKQLPLNTPEAAWRLMTDDEPLKMNTLTKGTLNCCLPPDANNFIVRKKDGYPAYQLSSLIDDVHFGVDLIVRGHDLLPSTIAQLYLAKALGLHGFSNATFHHHQLIMSNGAEKLSKSAGSTSIQYMRAHGSTSANVYNKIGVLSGITQPCFSLKDIFDNLVL